MVFRTPSRQFLRRFIFYIMEREIKFRAWQEESKKMLPNVGFHPHMASNLAAEDEYYESNDEGRWIVTPELGFKLMQFTGLKDKNGKEIYEGDHFGNPVFYVCFNDGCFTLGGLPLKGYLNGEYMEQVFDVKGNIYENPELLK